MVSSDLGRFPDLLAGLWSADPLVRMRAADAAEKITRRHRELLHPYKKELLGLMTETQQQELRWHLAVMIPRLMLSAKKRQVAIGSLNSYLEDRSSMVKTFALQGLTDLAHNDPGIRPEVIETLRAGCEEWYARDEGSQPQVAISAGACLMVRVSVSSSWPIWNADRPPIESL